MAKISTFDDLTDLFKKWQQDIGVDSTLFKDYPFEAFYDEPPAAEVEFGEFAGRRKWESLLEIPNQEMRD